MPEAMRRTKLWDLPVRLTHWSFVALLPALWWSATTKQDRLNIPQLSLDMKMLDFHIKLGCVMLGLVVFRVFWGLVGSQTARFNQFIKGPGTVIAYMRSLRSGEKSAPVVGHNPMGAISVVLLLGLLAAQVTIGLFISTVDGEEGPLAHLIGSKYYDFQLSLSEWHELGFNLILAFVFLHLAAILFYTFKKKDRLVPPMITGSKDLPDSVPAPRMAPLWRALPLIVIAAAFSWWLGKGAPTSLEQLNATPPPDASDYM
jgi:cytochrome b